MSHDFKTFEALRDRVASRLKITHAAAADRIRALAWQLIESHMIRPDEAMARVLARRPDDVVALLAQGTAEAILAMLDADAPAAELSDLSIAPAEAATDVTVEGER